jgi:alanine-glyoxylate transaminase / serine-glyoxylate transaminase / serine-pyruvate transaminase
MSESVGQLSTFNKDAFPQMIPPSRILLGPGPSMVDPRVLRAIAAPLVGHLDPFFLSLMDKTQQLLRYIFETQNQLTIPVSGTGNAAMETAVANMVEPGDAVLVCINGYFGQRLAEMAHRYGGSVETITRPWGEVFSPDEVKQALDKRKTKIVALVHAETSTGAQQPIKEISKVVHEHDAVLIVDAVTSLGGLPVKVDEHDIDVCYCGTQECLGCPPGLGPITFGPRAIDVIHHRKTPVISWYLDMSMIEQYWGSNRSYHHTAPISAVYGLYEGLRIIAEEGLTSRFSRHRANAEMLWSGLEDLDLSLHVDRAYRLPSLTSVRIPDGTNDTQMRKQLLDEYNFEIAGGLGELKGKIWRIGLMGYTSRKENIALLISALRDLLARFAQSE